MTLDFSPPGRATPFPPTNIVDVSADDVSFVPCLLSFDPLAHPHSETTGFHTNSDPFAEKTGVIFSPIHRCYDLCGLGATPKFRGLIFVY